MARRFTLVELLVVVALILVVLAVARPSCDFRSRMQPNENNAIAALKDYAALQREFLARGLARDADGTPRYAMAPGELRRLDDGKTGPPAVSKRFAEAVDRQTSWQGYFFVSPTASLVADGVAIDWTKRYELLAVPAEHGASGNAAFFVAPETPVARMKDMGRNTDAADYAGERPLDAGGGWNDI